MQNNMGMGLAVLGAGGCCKKKSGGKIEKNCHEHGKTPY